MLFSCPGTIGANASALITAGTNNSAGITATLTNRFINGTAEAARPAFDAATINPFFVSTTYIGAVRDASDNWWTGWTCGLSAGSSC
jgi:hypothetical protein